MQIINYIKTVQNELSFFKLKVTFISVSKKKYKKNTKVLAKNGKYDILAM